MAVVYGILLPLLFLLILPLVPLHIVLPVLLPLLGLIHHILPLLLHLFSWELSTGGEKIALMLLKSIQCDWVWRWIPTQKPEFNDWISDINLFDIKIPETNRKIKPSPILELDDFICPKVRTFWSLQQHKVQVKDVQSVVNLLGQVISLFLIALFLWAGSSVIPVIPVISVGWSRAAPLTAPCKVSRRRSLTMPACRELMGESPFNAFRDSHPVGDANNALVGGLNKSSSRLGSYL